MATVTRTASAISSTDLCSELPLSAPDVHEPHPLLDALEWDEEWQPPAAGELDAADAGADRGIDDEIGDDADHASPAPATTARTVRHATPGAATVVPTDEIESLDDATPLPVEVGEPGPSVIVNGAAVTERRPVHTGDGVEPPALPRSVTGEHSAAEGPSNGAARPPAPPPREPAGDEGLTQPAREAAGPDDDFVSELMADEAEQTTRRTQAHWYLEVFDESWLRLQGHVSETRLDREAAFIERSLSLTSGARVLEIACGAGSHMLSLARKGYDLVGVDKALSLLERGLQTAQRESLNAKFVLGDMRELTFEAVFDGAYCVGSSFGYFDEATDVDVMRRVARSLRPGAHVLFEQVNRDWVVNDVPRRSWWEVEELTIMDDLSLDPRTSRLHVERSILDGDAQTWEQHITMRLYAAHEWRALMEAAGLELVELSGHWMHRGAYFGPLSRHVIAVGRRPDAG